MDYSQLSDFEIQQEVLKATWGSHPPRLLGRMMSDIMLCDFDPCNNPADAWTIIESKLICLAADVFAEPHDGGKWIAQPAYGWEKERVRSDNPLRAAMIVFLMMQDAKHA